MKFIAIGAALGAYLAIAGSGVAWSEDVPSLDRPANQTESMIAGKGSAATRYGYRAVVLTPPVPADLASIRSVSGLARLRRIEVRFAPVRPDIVRVRPDTSPRGYDEIVVRTDVSTLARFERPAGQLTRHTPDAKLETKTGTSLAMAQFQGGPAFPVIGAASSAQPGLAERAADGDLIAAAKVLDFRIRRDSLDAQLRTRALEQFGGAPGTYPYVVEITTPYESRVNGVVVEKGTYKRSFNGAVIVTRRIGADVSKVDDDVRFRTPTAGGEIKPVEVGSVEQPSPSQMSESERVRRESQPVSAPVFHISLSVDAGQIASRFVAENSFDRTFGPDETAICRGTERSTRGGLDVRIEAAVGDRVNALAGIWTLEPMTQKQRFTCTADFSAGLGFDVSSVSLRLQPNSITGYAGFSYDFVDTGTYQLSLIAYGGVRSMRYDLRTEIEAGGAAFEEISGSKSVGMVGLELKYRRDLFEGGAQAEIGIGYQHQGGFSISNAASTEFATANSRVSVRDAESIYGSLGLRFAF